MELRHLRYDSDTHPWIDISIDVQDRKLNVLFEGVFDDLLAAIERIRSGSLDRPVVLRSAKEKGFVVGADLKKILAIDSDAGIQAFLKHGQDVLIELEQLPNPTFAWIRGPCLGGGLELALACKFLLVCDSVDTVLGMPETKLGLTPGWGGTSRLIQRVGVDQGAKMLVVGEPIRAEQAFECGLANSLWAKGLDENEVIAAELHAFSNKAGVKRSFDRRDSLRTWTEKSDWFRDLINEGLQEAELWKRHAREQVLRCIEVGLRENPLEGQRCEREGFYSLLSAPECQATLQLFSQPKGTKNQ